MGFNGDVVVYRSARALSEFDSSVGDASHPVYGEWTGNDGWRIVHVRHFDDPAEYERPWLERLADETGAPALVCNVFESDVASMQGVSKAGYWEGPLDPASTMVTVASRRLEELACEAGQDVYFVGGEFGDERLYETLAGEVRAELDRARPGLAEAVVAWAEDAGQAVRVADVISHLERRKSPCAEHLFFELLDLLGLTGSRLEP